MNTLPNPEPAYSPEPAPVAVTSGPLHGYNVLAVVSFITAFVAIIPALVLSPIALRQIRETGERGRGLAIGGLVVAIVSLVFLVLFLLFYIGMIASFFFYAFNQPEMIYDY